MAKLNFCTVCRASLAFLKTEIYWLKMMEFSEQVVIRNLQQVLLMWPSEAVTKGLCSLSQTIFVYN